MNILLYLPGLLLVINWSTNYAFTLAAVLYIVLFQLAIATPFLLNNPRGYFTMAFDFSRQFDHVQSAYWQFLPTDVFSSRVFHTSLLVLHVTFLLIFLFRKAAYGKSVRGFLISLNLPSSFRELYRFGNGCKLEPEGK
jgi:alpha-1,3-mannosyltransferase